MTSLQEKSKVTAFFDNELKTPPRTKLEGRVHSTTSTLEPSSRHQIVKKKDFPKLVEHVFAIKDKTDLVISGLGWIRVTGTAKVAVWAPEGVAVVT